jgi:uncharacterized glyoxalase superfamily protein PhnB
MEGLPTSARKVLPFKNAVLVPGRDAARRARAAVRGLRYTCPMIRQIAPQFFTTDIPATVAYYKDKLGFECLGTWQDPPVYAIVARDRHAIHFRCAAPPTANPDKYADELLDAYLNVEDADALYAEYAANGVEFTRGLANMPWRSREFVVKDCDGRLLAFGANL